MQLPPPPGRAPVANSLQPGSTGIPGLPGDARGQILGDGRYEVGDLLGTGGMAEVRRCLDKLLGREVAVKLFRSHSEGRLSDRERTEAQLLASLDHPGLVKVHDVGRSAQFGWVVMDLIDGPDLHHLLYAGPLALGQARTIGHDVARTLAYVHGRRITHRDVKPSNILTRDADPHSGQFGYVLTDFGIARRADSARLTATGETIGTAAYFSPEQARGDTVSPASDVYSLGLVLLECLTGEAAFPGRGLETALARLHRSPEIPPSVNPVWRRLITRMTASDPVERPTSAEVAHMIVAERERLLSEGRPATVIAQPDPEPTRRNFVLGVNDDDERLDPAPAEPAAHPRKQPKRQAPAAAPGLTDKPDRRASTPKAPRAGRQHRALLAGAVVVVLVLVAAAVVLVNLLGQASQLEPLPSVPGEPGERLSELYESVQP
ncbi:serine/threonine protein kinase [Arthrobacter pigmenti]|uniref:non-specific serine/threonine protein kinase n=1 Tax=Arthrobacter pigmenti TaxID=271432 RepID=A0A846RLU0_9MICC|nr:serine/threonine-protein kinase [Arthrobacter pigmenti]NJC21602.1 serine/threonine protein kinase [Arthrobacter pigmenti]